VGVEKAGRDVEKAGRDEHANTFNFLYCPDELSYLKGEMTNYCAMRDW